MLDHIIVKICLWSLYEMSDKKKTLTKIRNAHFIILLLMLIFQYDL